jgi:hypothetical protein
MNNNHLGIIKAISETINSKEEEVIWGIIIFEVSHIKISIAKITTDKITFMDRIVTIDQIIRIIRLIMDSIMVIKIILETMVEVKWGIEIIGTIKIMVIKEICIKLIIRHKIIRTQVMDFSLKLSIILLGSKILGKVCHQLIKQIIKIKVIKIE